MLAFHSWAENWNFGEVIRPILESENASNDEISYMQRYRWEFFVINAGSANFRGAGTSLKRLQQMFKGKVQFLKYMAVVI